MGERKGIFRFMQRIPIRWRLTLVSWGLLVLLLTSLGIVISNIAGQDLVTNEVAALQNEVQVAWKGDMKSFAGEHPFELPADLNSTLPSPPVSGNLISPNDVDSKATEAATDLLYALNNEGTYENTNAVIILPNGTTMSAAKPRTSGGPPSSAHLSSRITSFKIMSLDRVKTIMYSGSPYTMLNKQGARLLVVFVPLVKNGSLVGILSISTSTASIDSFLTPFRQILFLGIAVTLCLAIALTFPLVDLALRPLVDIERTTRRIAQGELSTRINPPLTQDEIGRLARSFNQMVAQLEEAFKRQKRFVSDVSHELRTPLTALSGSLEMLLIGADQGGSEASRRLARGMYTEVQRMHRMVEDLLALTRLDEGRLTLRNEVMSVEPLLQTVCAQAKHLAHGQKLRCVTEPDIPTICVDRDRLQQILLNLMDNAVKFTPPEGQIELRASNGPEHTVVLTVSDSGQGIAPDALPHVFDRFYRADPSRSRSSQRVGGSGLGLAIAKELVEAQGGTIRISSVAGAGTTVSIRFPRVTTRVAPTMDEPAHAVSS
jgi:two-component system, OmpR family, sensor kinase